MKKSYNYQNQEIDLQAQVPTNTHVHAARIPTRPGLPIKSKRRKVRLHYIFNPHGASIHPPIQKETTHTHTHTGNPSETQTSQANTYIQYIHRQSRLCVRDIILHNMQDHTVKDRISDKLCGNLVRE